MASSSIVIKVKFGETLRRLNVSINDKKLALDMVMLKEKIRSLFSFGSDVEFTLTYVDEDGDEVTLADDGDLLDVVSQSLNPLRITVSLKGSNFNGSSGNSTPLSSQNQHPFQTLNSGVSEVLKSIPEPLLEALAKLPLDLASKASSSSAPAVAELVDKVKDVYSNQILPSMASLRVQPTTGGPPNMNSESSTVKNSQVQVNPEAGDLNSKKKKKQVQKVTDGAKSKGVQAPISSTKSVGEASTGKNKDATDGVDKKKDSSSEKKDDISSDPLKKPLKHDSFVEHMNQMRQNYKNQWHHLQDQLAAQRAQYGTNQCPFSGMPLTTDYDFHGHHHRSRSPHWKRYNFDNNNNNMNNHNNNNNNNNNNMNNNNNNTGNIFHRGIICDGCGVHPITGPRFKSKVKIDYDLCSICFAEMGNATDYIRMDHPTSSFSHHLMSLRGLYDPSLHIPPPGTLPHTMQTPGSNLSRSKLDSRFILDVSVLDGTTMAPYTAFTKIWRMQNNGSVVWPYGSQLQWIGGDCLSNSHSVDVEIPVHGLLVNKEVDIAVDLTAPELPGRYVSYWRMSSPSGEKFGQQVWVVIQVDAPVKNLGETSINLNLPPVTRDLEAVNHDRLVDNIFSENDIITDLENTSVDTPPKDHAKDFPINDSLIINSGGVSSTMATLSAPPETASSSVLNSTEVGAALGSLPAGSMVTSGLDNEPISPPTVDFSVMPPIVSSGAASLPTVVLQPPSGSVSQVVTDDKEQALVKELEAMGFMNLDLNKEILRIHNYDLDKSIDDLCGILEWDPILDELREMGFLDDEANRRLLKKNNGSIKGVVMDLISEEKA